MTECTCRGLIKLKLLTFTRLKLKLSEYYQLQHIGFLHYSLQSGPILYMR